MTAKSPLLVLQGVLSDPCQALDLRTFAIYPRQLDLPMKAPNSLKRGRGGGLGQFNPPIGCSTLTSSCVRHVSNF